mgnify:CR=1 FL=1
MKDKFLSLEDLKNGKFQEKLDLSELISVAKSYSEEIANSDMSDEEKDEELEKMYLELVELRDKLNKNIEESKEKRKIQNN